MQIYTSIKSILYHLMREVFPPPINRLLNFLNDNIFTLVAPRYINEFQKYFQEFPVQFSFLFNYFIN